MSKSPTAAAIQEILPSIRLCQAARALLIDALWTSTIAITAVGLGMGLILIVAAEGSPASAQAAPGMTRGEVYQQVREISALGRRMFSDSALSASGALSCASCHSPNHAYGPPNALPVQLGGIDLRQPGRRAVPSLKYLQAAPRFTEHYFESDDEGDESIDNGPSGGLTWDGRVDRGRDQARLPLLSPWEMANDSPADVVARVRQAGYDEALRRIFGPEVLGEPEKTFNAILKAFEVFEQEPADFYPYSSKYDAVLAGKAMLTPQEARGLALFNDPAKGNCAKCHVSKPGRDGSAPQFTDYGLVALGAPRNSAIPANADPQYFDLGVCGPFRTDFRDRAEYCGLFMTPTLRNVAIRRVFFHNGVFQSLRQVLEFYVERDTRPEKWYPRSSDGAIRKFDDLPPEHDPNINVEAPFDRKAGDQPALIDQEIEDIIAFLQTLTDGFVPE
jgi:cytochrome c peroxidase